MASLFWAQVKHGDTTGLAGTLAQETLGIDVNEPDVFGFTAVHWAVQNGFPKVLRVLHSCGAALDVFDADGQTPLHLALSKQDPALAAELLDLGANVHLKDARGFSPMHQACSAGSVAHTALLASRGASLQEGDARQGFSPLHIAVSEQHSEILALLAGLLAKRGLLSDALQQRASAAHSPSRPTPLLLACLRPDPVAAAALLALLPSVHVNLPAADDGSTPLHLAVRLSSLSLAAALLSHGADPSLQDNSGVSAASLALSLGFALPSPPLASSSPALVPPPVSPAAALSRPVRSRKQPKKRSLHSSLRHKKHATLTSLAVLFTPLPSSSGDLIVHEPTHSSSLTAVHRTSHKKKAHKKPSSRQTVNPSSITSSPINSSTDNLASINSSTDNLAIINSSTDNLAIINSSTDNLASSTDDLASIKSSTENNLSLAVSITSSSSTIESTPIEPSHLQPFGGNSLLSTLYTTLSNATTPELKRAQLQMALSSAHLSPSGLREQLARRIASLQSLLSAEQCSRCHSSPVSHLALPCSHLSFCRACLPLRELCHLCNAPVTGYSPAHLAR